MKFEIKSRLDDLYNHDDLSKDNYKFLEPCACKLGVMYGLCKVHKSTTDNDNVPAFRLLLSAIDTGNYNLSKFFVSILKQFGINEYTVKDSFSFSKEILDQDPKFLWDLLTFNRCSQIFHWMRQLTFVLAWFLKIESKKYA